MSWPSSHDKVGAKSELKLNVLYYIQNSSLQNIFFKKYKTKKGLEDRSRKSLCGSYVSQQSVKVQQYCSKSNEHHLNLSALDKYYHFEMIPLMEFSQAVNGCG